MFRTPSDYTYTDFKDLDKEYILKPFDKLNIIISTNDGANLINYKGGTTQNIQQNALTYLIEHDGLVKLPSLGRVEITGMTIREAEKNLEEKYSALYNDPYVKLTVTNRRVFIFTDGGMNGQVLTLEEENTTLIEAIASTGGLSLDSKAYRIKLIRGDLNKDPEVYIYNIYNLKGIEKANLLLQANDIIYVESRPRYVSKVLGEVTPYLTLLSTMLLIYGLLVK